jgi:hypothetical protein
MQIAPAGDAGAGADGIGMGGPAHAGRSVTADRIARAESPRTPDSPGTMHPSVAGTTQLGNHQGPRWSQPGAQAAAEVSWESRFVEASRPRRSDAKTFSGGSRNT